MGAWTAVSGGDVNVSKGPGWDCALPGEQHFSDELSRGRFHPWTRQLYSILFAAALFTRVQIWLLPKIGRPI